MFSKGPKITSPFGRGTKVHLVGIKGVGLTALAQILQSRGCKVTGSDGYAKFFTDDVLTRMKIPVAMPFSGANIPEDVDVVVSSTAYFFDGKSLNNIETQEAILRGLKILTYPQALGILAKEYKVIAVAGSHGKSTTTALLGWILEQTGLDPTVIVGTKVNKWESNARQRRVNPRQKGSYLIVEADEYREAFLNYRPQGAIITSIDYDHPDYFKTKASYFNAFKKLVNNVKQGGWIVIAGGDPNLRRIIAYAKKKKIKVISYGFSKTNDVQVSDWGIASVRQAQGEKQMQLFHILFHAKQKGAREWRGSIGFPGQQYVANSAAAFVTALQLGAKPEKIIKAIASFPGTARRLEILQKAQARPDRHAKRGGQALIIDDYAHHPTAIRVTMNGVRRMYPNKKLIAIFQPHMFSRTAALLDAFSRSFSDADEVGIMEIYPSAREKSGPVNGQDLARATQKHHARVTYLETMSAARQFVKEHNKKSNLILLMGAGDVYKLAG